VAGLGAIAFRKAQNDINSTTWKSRPVISYPSSAACYKAIALCEIKFIDNQNSLKYNMYKRYYMSTISRKDDYHA